MTKYVPDEYDKKIIKELIVNPRLSDNKISIITKIPVKTVNRKRKNLEKKEIISYLTAVDFRSTGTGDFGARIMYIIEFKYGIFRKQFIDVYHQMTSSKKDIKHINLKWLGEKDGHLILILILESRKYSDILEIYNVEIFNKITKILGLDAIVKTTTIPITTTLTFFHNYEPLTNMKNGKIKEDWPRDMIFAGGE